MKFNTRCIPADSFAEFFSKAMIISKSPQILSLWKVDTASICDSYGIHVIYVSSKAIPRHSTRL